MIAAHLYFADARATLPFIGLTVRTRAEVMSREDNTAGAASFLARGGVRRVTRCDHELGPPSEQQF